MIGVDELWRVGSDSRISLERDRVALRFPRFILQMG